MYRMRMFMYVVLLGLLCQLQGCGIGGATNSDSSVSSGGIGVSPQLATITVSGSAAATTLGGETRQFIATGTYSDGSTASLTSAVTWSSSDTTVATVSNSAGSNGTATPTGGGITTITAALGGISGSTTLNVITMGGTSQGRPLALAGTVSTVAGAGANFNLPVGITTDGRNLYVADCNNHIIRRIVIATGAVSTLAGTSGHPATVDGAGTAAMFYFPRGITTDGTCLYVAETDSNSIRKVVISTGAVTTLAHVSSPAGITTDGVYLYVTDSLNHVIRRITISSGAVATVAGTAGIPGATNGVGTGASFASPVGITTDGSSLYVNDFGNNMIRRIVLASGQVSTVAAGFSSPATGITTDGTNLYVGDYGNTIRSIAIPSGTFSTLVGAGAGLSHPEGLTSDGIRLYIVDSLNNLIRTLI